MRIKFRNGSITITLRFAPRPTNCTLETAAKPLLPKRIQLSTSHVACGRMFFDLSVHTSRTRSLLTDCKLKLPLQSITRQTASHSLRSTARGRAGRQHDPNSRIAWNTISLGSLVLADKCASPPISTRGYAKAHSCANSSFPWRIIGSKKATTTTAANARQEGKHGRLA